MILNNKKTGDRCDDDDDDDDDSGGDGSGGDRDIARIFLVHFWQIVGITLQWSGTFWEASFSTLMTLDGADDCDADHDDDENERRMRFLQMGDEKIGLDNIFS